MNLNKFLFLLTFAIYLNVGVAQDISIYDKVNSRQKVKEENKKKSPKATIDSSKISPKDKSRNDINILLGITGAKLPEKRPKKPKASPDDMRLQSALYQRGMILYKSALKDYMSGNYKNSIQLLKDVINIDPLHKNAYLYLIKAEEAFKTRENPTVKIENQDNRNSVVNEIQFQTGLEFFLNKEYNKAIKTWQKLVKRSPTFHKAFVYIKKAEERQDKIAENFLNQGLYYFEKEKIDKAIKEWEKGIILCPENEQLLAQLEIVKGTKESVINEIINEGNSKLSEKKYDAAIKIFSNALKKYPQTTIFKEKISETRKFAEKHLKEKFNLAKSLYKEKKFKKSLKLFTEILLITSDNIVARDYANRCKKKVESEKKISEFSKIFKEGISSLENRNFHEANDKFEIIKKSNPGYPNLAEKMEETSNGIKSIEKRKRATISFNKGLSHFKNGYYSSAIKEWKMVLKANPNNSVVKQYLKTAGERLKESTSKRKNRSANKKKAVKISKEALLLYKAKKYSEAYNKYQSALKLDPNNRIMTKGLRATKRELLIKKEKLTPAIEKKVKNLFHKGITFYRTGKFKKAIECWEQVVNLQPNHIKAQKFIENVNRKLEKIRKI